MNTVHNLSQLIVRRFTKFHSRIALSVDGKDFSYGELLKRASAIASTLTRAYQVMPTHSQPICALLTTRTPSTYQAVLGTILSGAAYTPLNPQFPAERNATIVQQSGASVIFVDKSGLVAATELFQVLKRTMPIVIVTSDLTPGDVPEFCTVLPVCSDEIAVSDTDSGLATAASAPAYIMFTSGSTGKPKGVSVSHANVLNYIRNFLGVIPYKSDDCTTQLFDLTFDLSVHDMFVTWSSGARLLVIPNKNLMIPIDFVAQNAVTVWFSTPTTVNFISHYNKLQPDCLPNLRLGIFCGESLPTSMAQGFQKAAPNAAIENIYGPTEATIACTRFSATPDRLASAGPVVPIGWPLPNQEIAIRNMEGNIVVDEGELLLGGNQIALGYHGQPDLTNKAFLSRKFPGKLSQRWYRTGDLVRYSEESGLEFLGRVDRQTKIRGHRVEITEVESVVSNAIGGDLVGVVPWPRHSDDGTALGLTALFVGDYEEAELKEACKAKLPDYMVPQRFIKIIEMPINSSGKKDYQALMKIAQTADRRTSSMVDHNTMRTWIIEQLHEQAGPKLVEASWNGRDDLNLLDIIDSYAFLDLTMEIEDQLGISMDLSQVDVDKIFMLDELVDFLLSARNSP